MGETIARTFIIILYSEYPMSGYNLHVGFGGGFERFEVGTDSMEVINSMSLTYGAHGDAISNYHTQAIFREEKEESGVGCELSQPDKAFN
ncbi:hypothetical protein V1478_017440 [Vespula squamosa]|uniref:Uncharacterized protein n=1 Tax=Vespula squamosa TaxID=30214 RepID=A0ABD1ZWV3_VESSQ